MTQPTWLHIMYIGNCSEANKMDNSCRKMTHMATMERGFTVFSGTLGLTFKLQHQVHRKWQHTFWVPSALQSRSPHAVATALWFAITEYQLNLENNKSLHLSNYHVGSSMWQRLTHRFLLVATLIIIIIIIIIIISSLALSRWSLALLQSTACKGHSIT